MVLRLKNLFYGPYQFPEKLFVPLNLYIVPCSWMFCLIHFWFQCSTKCLVCLELTEQEKERKIREEERKKRRKRKNDIKRYQASLAGKESLML